MIAYLFYEEIMKYFKQQSIDIVAYFFIFRDEVTEYYKTDYKFE